jgi:hypothetical protein
LVGPQGGELVTNSGFTIEFPEGAVPNDTKIRYQKQTEQHPLPENHNAALTFSLEAHDADGLPVTQFALPYTMIITYTDREIAELGINESTLFVAFWNGSSWIDVFPCDGCQLDTNTNTVTIQLDHFTDFALMGDTRWRTYLPLTTR